MENTDKNILEWEDKFNKYIELGKYSYISTNTFDFVWPDIRAILKS